MIILTTHLAAPPAHLIYRPGLPQRLYSPSADQDPQREA